MRRDQRLASGSQIAAVFKQGKTWSNSLMLLKALPNNLDRSRFCFVVSKKVEKRAVMRNRVRRLLRESVRLATVEVGWDVVLIARREAVGISFVDMQRAVLEIMARARLLGIG